MDDSADLYPRARALLAGSVLEPYVSNYRTRLIERRYAAITQRGYLGCVAHFASWLTATRIGLDGVNKEAGERFVAEHLPQCINLPIIVATMRPHIAWSVRGRSRGQCRAAFGVGAGERGPPAASASPR